MPGDPVLRAISYRVKSGFSLMAPKVFSAAEDSEYLLEPLQEGADSTLYRGRKRANQLPILAVVVAAEQPSPQILQRLEHEYSLASELDPAWAAQPLVLTRHQGRAVLILRDPGGEPLDRFIEQHKGQDLTRLLPIAIGLAAALSQVHRQGLIHKDVKPANALVDDAGHVWHTGFGIASRLPRERQAPAPPEIVGGTLAYMSPEQTGRMNRSMDARSDLYSLGVTLYQMLTGVLPFSAADPLEWVHCHIARQPVAPADRSAVPEPLSAHHHEAPRKECRGPIPDRHGPPSRSSTMLGGVAISRSHRSVPSGHGRLVGSIAHT
jgi:serine/threonine protein kinase